MTDEEFAKSLYPDPWKQDTGDTILNAVRTLRRYDLPSADIESVIGSLIGAMCEEYGE